MNIRDPKFKRGDKVRDIEDGTIFTLININSYGFDYDEYWYNLECDGLTCTRPESNLEPYIEKPKSVWDLQDGDTYYAINTFNGKIYKDTFCDNGYYLGKKRELCDLFLTKEEAETEVERRKIEAEMLRLGGRRNIKICNDNYYIMYDHKTRNLAYFNRNWMHSQGSIFFDTYVDVDKAVKAIGEDRIKKYIFGVE